MRKLTSILLLILLICNSVFCQNKGKNQEKAEHEAIQQIRTSGLADILSFQTQNRDINNMVLTHQIGDQNKASINQQAESGFGNQSYSIQQGNSNEMTVGQIGSGNVLLGFQLGYVTSEIERNQGNHYGFGLDNGNGNAYAYGHEKGTTETIVAGDRNKRTGRSSIVIDKNIHGNPGVQHLCTHRIGIENSSTIGIHMKHNNIRLQ